MKKVIFHNLCKIENIYFSGLSGEVEALYQGNLRMLNATWVCDILIADENLNSADLITVRYEDLSFVGDGDKRIWEGHLKVAMKKKTRRKKEEIKKLLERNPLCEN